MIAEGHHCLKGAIVPSSDGYIAQWLERLSADQQVPGSNPGVPFVDAWLLCIGGVLWLSFCLGGWRHQ
jgi:hypothetical protein